MREELINAGELDKRITYQTKQYSGRDDHGHELFAWADRVKRWASIRTMGGRESVTAERLQIVASHVIVTRTIPGADAQGRFLYGGRVFNISYVTDVNAKNIRNEYFVSEVINPK